MDATQRLAEFTHRLTLADLPASTVDACGRLALDTVGVGLAAWNAPGVRELRELSVGWSRGPSRLWVTGERVAPPTATLVNSSMAHALEYDDIHSDLPMHLGVVVLPAVLAVADARPGATGADAAAAIVAGCEVLCRMARATRGYRGQAGFRGWNPTAVVAGFAAATAAARMLGLDAEGTQRAMGLSYAQASGNQQCIHDGGLVKRMQPGLVAEAGVRAAYMAAAGITGAVNAMEGKHGFFHLYEQGEYDAEVLTADLGSRFEIDRVGFKRYPTCAMTHPGIDAVLDLKAEAGFTAADVESVEVYGSAFVTGMVGRPYEPGDNPQVAAQFSLGYTVATALLTGNVRLVDLDPSRTLDPERRQLASRVTVIQDDRLTGRWSTRVVVTLRGGRRLERSLEVSRGRADQPLSTDELIAKFRDCAAAAGPTFSTDRVDRLVELLLGLPRLGSLEPLGEALAPAPAARRASA